MRTVVRLFVKEGLAALTTDKRDVRQRMLYATPKLRQAVEEYARHFERVAAACN